MCQQRLVKHCNKHPILPSHRENILNDKCICMDVLHTGEMRYLEATVQLKHLMTAHVCEISMQNVVFFITKRGHGN
jgi:hypothetical protein